MPSTERRLQDLISIGPAMLRDFELLGIHSVSQLARQQPKRLHDDLCRVTGHKHDICCLDVFRAAVAQARDPHLATEQCQWWYWSRLRVGQLAKLRADCQSALDGSPTVTGGRSA